MSHDNVDEEKLGLNLALYKNVGRKNRNSSEKRVFYFKDNTFKLEKLLPSNEHNIFFIGAVREPLQIYSSLKINFPQYVLLERKKLLLGKIQTKSNFGYDNKKGGRIYPPETFMNSSRIKIFDANLKYHDLSSLEVVILDDLDVAVAKDSRSKIRILVGKGTFILEKPAKLIMDGVFSQGKMKKITYFDGALRLGRKLKIFDEEKKFRAIFVDLNEECQALVHKNNHFYVLDCGKYLLDADDQIFYLPKNTQTSGMCSSVYSNFEASKKITLNFVVRWKMVDLRLFFETFSHSNIRQVMVEKLKLEIYNWVTEYMGERFPEENRISELFLIFFPKMRENFKKWGKDVGLKIKNVTFKNIHFQLISPNDKFQN